VSFAWATVALLVLLLPGFLFYSALFFPETFSRDLAPRSPLGQLAASVSVAFLVHGVCLLILPTSDDRCAGWIACLDLKYALAAFQLEGAAGVGLAPLAENLSTFRLQILAYVVATSALGMALGYFVGSLIANGKIPPFLAQHSWVFRLNDAKYEYILTNVLTTHLENGAGLMYRGRLETFGLRQDGRFSYIVLTEAIRSELALKPFTEPKPAEVEDRTPQTRISPLNDESSGLPSGSSARGRARVNSCLFIDGEGIANVVFDETELTVTREGLAKLQEAKARWAFRHRAEAHAGWDFGTQLGRSLGMARRGVARSIAPIISLWVDRSPATVPDSSGGGAAPLIAELRADDIVAATPPNHPPPPA
jgi:hypothetical protein